MPLYSVFTAFVIFLISTNSHAGHLSDILQRMSEADINQNYQGTFILIKSDNLSTLQVTHGSDGKGVWESLETLNGESRKILRHDNKVISIYPEREQLTIRTDVNNQSLHQRLPKNINQLELYYTIEQLADDRVANHPVLVVDLIPNDKLRYGYRYWVDKNTGMLLRCDLVAEDGAVVEQMMFTSLNYLNYSPVKSFNLEQFSHYQQNLLDDQEMKVISSTPSQWVINTLPNGFMLMQSMMRYPEAGKQNNQQENLLHFVYSDGLASVSVFIEKNTGSGKHLLGSSTMGAVNAFGSSVDDYFVTVVGEVPVKTVQAMAQSVVKLK